MNTGSKFEGIKLFLEAIFKGGLPFVRWDIDEWWVKVQDWKKRTGRGF